MEGNIAELSGRCLALLNQCMLIPALKKDRWAEKQVGAFLLWIISIGASARGEASIDERLRIHHDIRLTIQSLLGALQRSLQDLITNSCREPLSEGSGLLTSSPSTAFVPDDHFQNIGTTLNYLNVLAIAIRRAGARHRDLRAEEFGRLAEGNLDIKECTREMIKAMRLSGMFRVFRHTGEILLVEDTVQATVFERIVECNVKRWSRFIYARHHHENLAGHSNPYREPIAIDTAEDEDQSSDEPEGTDYTPQVTRPAPTILSGAVSAATPIDRAYYITPSQPQTEAAGTSRHLGGSFVAHRLKLQYPTPPKVDGDADYFQCSCCYQMLPIEFHEADSWRKHVKIDLRPYVCLNETCAQPYETFHDTKDWLLHMESEHKHNAVHWTCGAAKHEQPQIFKSESDFENHMRADHPKMATKTQLPIITKRSRGPGAQLFSSCHLCGWSPNFDDMGDSISIGQRTSAMPSANVSRNGKAKEKVMLSAHISEHLQEIALRSLPIEVYQNEDASVGSSACPPSSSASTISRHSITVSEPNATNDDRLKQRRNIIKELVETEKTFERDMTVVVDIYKATAEPIASKADLAAIFINSEDVVKFSKSFGTRLKNTAKLVYDKSRTVRSSSAQPSLSRSHSYSETSDDDEDLSDTDRDRQTRIGEVFLASVADMEPIYKEYLVKQNAANIKSQKVLQTEKGKLWTSMCYEESRDLTSAWDLPSLLVKPVQRSTSYGLFLTELIKVTPVDHPDYEFLKKASEEIDAMMNRINEARKHAELLEQAMGHKRKDLSATKGLTLPKINRGTEKLKQNMSLAEAYEDTEFTKLFRLFDQQLVYFMTVIVPDQQNYRTSITGWIEKLCRIADLCDAWVEVQPTKHIEMESKLRRFSQAARSIQRVGIQPHLTQVDKEVFEPIRTAFKMLMDFKQEPQGLLMEREKRLVDYARFRRERDRTGKVDRKSTEKIEQWEALNREAKTRLSKLIDLSWQIRVTSYVRFAPIHVPWFEMITSNLAEAMSIDVTDLGVPELERNFKADFDLILSAILNLGICNGTLALEVSNMVTMSGSDSRVSTRDVSLEQEQQYARHSANSPVLFTVASIYEFNIDRARSKEGWPYLTYTSGELFDVIREEGELWLSRSQDQPEIVGWIWYKHFSKLAS